MAKQFVDRVPFKLSALPEEHLVCALGPQRILRALRRLDGAEMRTHPQGEYVTFPPTRHGMMAAEAMAAPAYTAPEYNEVRRIAMSVPAPVLAAWREIAPRFCRPLFRHQEEFCALAYGRRAMFNASEQGTGKTATAIALSAAWGSKLTLVVCPKSLMWQWHDEIHKTLAELEGVGVVPLDGVSVAERADALPLLLTMAERLVAIVNYDVVANMRTVLEDITSTHGATLILDESWRVKDKGTQVTKAIIKIADHCQHVLCLTGTPIGQGIKDMWSQLRIIEGKDPPDMESFNEWCYAYEQLIWVTKDGRTSKKAIGCKDPIGMMRRLDHYFYRATKATCLDLPPKLPTERIQLTMPLPTRRIYKDVEENGEAALGDGSSLMGERTTILRLQQIVGGFVYDPDGTYSEEIAGQPHDLRLRLLGSPKIEWVIEFTTDQLIGDYSHRVIIWAKFNSEVLHICNRLKSILGDERVAAITGTTKDADLEAIKTSFNSREEDGVQVMVVQIKKMAYGQNLQAGDTNIYYSHTWSHIEKSQSADRTHRYGRTAPVRYIELCMRDSVDETILSCTDQLQSMHERLAPDTSEGREVE